jgi:hypothetical protein
VASEVRIGGASEVVRRGASERRIGGASEISRRGASERRLEGTTGSRPADPAEQHPSRSGAQ